MFADAAVARRIEAAEAAGLLRIAWSIERTRPQRRVIAFGLGAGAAIFAGGTPVDKITGIGFEPLDWGALEAYEREVLQRGEVRVEISTLADGAVMAALCKRGYLLSGFENVLGTKLDPALADRLAASLPAGVEVRPVRDGEQPLWTRTVASGFMTPDVFDGPPPTEAFDREAVEGIFRDMEQAGGVERYLALRGGEVAGGASFSLEAGIAQLMGAATLPEHRRKGVQTALLRTRLIDAARRGADLAVVTTQPGSKSQQNVMRENFTLLYARAVLIKRP